MHLSMFIFNFRLSFFAKLHQARHNFIFVHLLCRDVNSAHDHITQKNRYDNMFGGLIRANFLSIFVVEEGCNDDISQSSAIFWPIHCSP